jgi:hypothetical protein
MADALITSRDGIVGSWATGGTSPALDVELADNMRLWEPRIRANVIDFELHAKLGFSADKTTETAYLWHLNVTAAAAGTPPSIASQPLMMIKRPDTTDFEKQLNFVASYADLRQDRASESLEQLPGPLVFMASIGFLRPDRTR